MLAEIGHHSLHQSLRIRTRRRRGSHAAFFHRRPLPPCGASCRHHSCHWCSLAVRCPVALAPRPPARCLTTTTAVLRTLRPVKQQQADMGDDEPQRPQPPPKPADGSSDRHRRHSHAHHHSGHHHTAPREVTRDSLLHTHEESSLLGLLPGAVSSSQDAHSEAAKRRSAWLNRRGSTGSFSNAQSALKNTMKDTLWVGNIPDSHAKGSSKLKGLFEGYGTVLSGTVRRKQVGGNSRRETGYQNWAFVTFEDGGAGCCCVAAVFGCLVWLAF
jgi:hypothetical protein